MTTGDDSILNFFKICMRFETPDFSILKMSKDEFIRSRGPKILARAKRVYPLFLKDDKKLEPEQYARFETEVTTLLSKQWDNFHQIAPILEQDDMLNRFMAVIYDRLNCKCRSPLGYNFTAAISISLLLDFTLHKPRDFNPHNLDSLKLLANSIDYICHQVRTNYGVERGDGTITFGIVARIIYMTYIGVYFDTPINLLVMIMKNETRRSL